MLFYISRIYHSFVYVVDGESETLYLNVIKHVKFYASLAFLIDSPSTAHGINTTLDIIQSRHIQIIQSIAGHDKDIIMPKTNIMLNVVRIYYNMAQSGHI